MSTNVLQGSGWVFDGDKEIAYVTYTLANGNFFYLNGILVVDDLGALSTKGLRLRLEDGQDIGFVVTDNSVGNGIHLIRILWRPAHWR